jgi:hypothetical protein
MNYLVELRTQEGTTNVIRKLDEFYSERLGASLSPLSREEMEDHGIRTGLKVVNVDDGMLNKGGIRTGFIIATVNGFNVGSKAGLESALEENPERVRISGIYPNGMKVTFEFGL